MLVYRKFPLKLPSTSILNGVYCAHHFNTVRRNKQTNKQSSFDNIDVLKYFVNFFLTKITILVFPKY